MIQNKINEISGSNVRRDVEEGKGGSISDFYTDYNQMDDPFAGGGEGATAEGIHAYNEEHGDQWVGNLGDDKGPTDDTVEKALSRRELRQQARRDRKASRIENLQRKRANLSEAGDAKYERLLNREHRMAKRQQNVGEGAKKFRERRDKVMQSMRDSKVGKFFKGNTSS